MVGNGVTVKLTDKDLTEINLLLSNNNCQAIQASYGRVYTRASHGHQTYFARQYQKMKKRNAYTVSYHDMASSNGYCLIEKFLEVEGHYIAVVEKLIKLTGCHFMYTKQLLQQSLRKSCLKIIILTPKETLA